MDVTKILADIIDNNDPFDAAGALNLMLPPREGGTYSLDEIAQKMDAYFPEIEALQHSSNNKFDIVLDNQVQSRFRTLSDNIAKTQRDLDHLKDEILLVRRQLDQVKDVCHNDASIKERRDLLELEEKLKLDLQRSKFTAILSFFERYCAYLEASIDTCKRLLVSSTANYIQIFDWANYHQTIFLLRACGQAIYDLERFECLYQSSRDIYGLSFRQLIDKIDLSNFVEFHGAYSLETQVDVILNGHGDRCELGNYLKDPQNAHLSEAPDNSQNLLFKGYLDKVRNLTVECCRLLVDINLEYIESHLTDGINIDKLNRYDPSSSAPIGTLPAYAFSPQDYITQIGQHLLALKKQTDKFDQIDGRPLLRALKFLRYVRNCELEVEIFKSATEVILKCVARQVIRSLVGRTTASVLSQLNANGLKQIATDAMYLDGVLSDLNLLDSSEPFVEKFRSLFMRTS